MARLLVSASVAEGRTNAVPCMPPLPSCGLRVVAAPHESWGCRSFEVFSVHHYGRGRESGVSHAESARGSGLAFVLAATRVRSPTFSAGLILVSTAVQAHLREQATKFERAPPCANLARARRADCPTPRSYRFERRSSDCQTRHPSGAHEAYRSLWAFFPAFSVRDCLSDFTYEREVTPRKGARPGVSILASLVLLRVSHDALRIYTDWSWMITEVFGDPYEYYIHMTRVVSLSPF